MACVSSKLLQSIEVFRLLLTCCLVGASVCFFQFCDVATLALGDLAAFGYRPAMKDFFY
jgi:hypothetical protein